MTHFKFLCDQPINMIEKPISEGASFVFTFLNEAYSKLDFIILKLQFSPTNSYFGVKLHRSWGIFKVRDSLGNRRDISKVNLGREDTNIVVRVEKVGPASIAAYINDEYIAGVVTRSECKFDNVWINCRWNPSVVTTDKVPITLTVFGDAERGQAESFAHAIRNPEAADFEAEESAIMTQAAATTQVVMAAREQDLEARETALEQREKESASVRGGDGSDENTPLGLNVHPPDTEFMKLSATLVWPRASNQVLGSSSFAPIQERHDTMMSEWVVARGDGISSNAYDYFVYSHGVVWPKVVLEYTTDVNLTKIRERHAVIMNVLL